jgi:hypothetical protein
VATQNIHTSRISDKGISRLNTKSRARFLQCPFIQSHQLKAPSSTPIIPKFFPPIIGISACIVVLSFTLVRDHLMGKLSRSEHGLPRSFQRSRAMPQRPVKPCYPSQISTLEPSRYLWEPKASPQSIGAEDWRELSYLDGMISRR